MVWPGLNLKKSQASGSNEICFKFQHSKQIIHRDIKAENVIFAHQGWVKLADFGFSCICDELTMLHTFCGSPPSAAPELFKDQVVLRCKLFLNSCLELSRSTGRHLGHRRSYVFHACRCNSVSRRNGARTQKVHSWRHVQYTRLCERVSSIKALSSII